MHFAKVCAGLVSLASCGAAAAQTHASEPQKTWVATLDLRNLPASKRPSAILARIDAGAKPGEGVRRLTIRINGIVIGRAWSSADGSTTIRAPLEDRLISTRNRVEISVTATNNACAGCSVDGARLVGTPWIQLSAASANPILFSQHVTRLRHGVTLAAKTPQEQELAALTIAALGPRAPRKNGAPGRIVVSKTMPAGTSPPLRFDNGPVSITDRNGRTLYSEPDLDSMTIVQIARAGERPVIWVRPAADGSVPHEIELDYGNVALFSQNRREIAFSPDQDTDLRVTYASAAEADAQSWLYWRLAIGAVWLVITIGTIVILRRLPPMGQKEAEA